MYNYARIRMLMKHLHQLIAIEKLPEMPNVYDIDFNTLKYQVRKLCAGKVICIKVFN